jgi:AraC-like DNA-binding protein
MSTGKGIMQGRFGRVVLLDIDRPVVAHAHPHCHILFKVGGADSVFRVQDRDYPLTDDTAVVVNTWEPHAYPHDAGTPKSLVLALYVEIDWLAVVERSFAASANPRFFDRPCVAVPHRVRKIVGDIADALLAPDGADHGHEELLLDLMIAVIDEFSQWRTLRSGRSVRSRPIRDFRVRRAVAFMRDNLGRPFRFDDVAFAAGLSRAHLFEVFRENTGLTPNLYYNALRMERAYDVLPSAQDSMAAITSSLGFSAQSHFSRFFRNNLGIPPSEYRRAVRLG